jgi:hypothetical protein
LVDFFLATDDDEVRERAMLVAYGTLIHSKDETVLKKLGKKLLTRYAAQPGDFQNAIIRDHIRCIAELAAHLGCLDNGLPSSIYFHVPARIFFKAGPLSWNSADGFSTPEGKAIFRDPSASEGGPATLLADKDELLGRLEKLGYRLVWTLLGEKYVLGDHASDAPRVTYSQTAVLNKDGSLSVGDRVFFDDYDKDQGLALDP